ncbi:MAG: PQQ-binding-like beta-propeller repeat protein [Candidatus Aureabacteria bacterium]|nr:PQQ-binding-like beta-propeller repeat protein [Candidatus Auribacterota bacterium]
MKRHNLLHLFWMGLAGALALFGSECAAQPMSSPWPMFRHDAQRTGRSVTAGSWTGILAWSYEVGGGVISSPALDTAGNVYFGSLDRNLSVLTSNGFFLWSYAAGGALSSSPAIDTAGRIYSGADDNTCYALSPSGALAWSYNTAGNLFSSPAINGAGSVYTGSLDNSLYVIASSGQIEWSYTMAGGIQSSPALETDWTVYIGSNDNNLYSFGSDGAFSWSYAAHNAFYASPLVNDGMLYAGSVDNAFYALNTNGALKWSYEFGDSIYASSAIHRYGDIYIGSCDNNLYVISAGGTLQWSYDSGGDPHSSPAVDPYTVYCGSSADTMHSIKLGGTLRWSYKAGDTIRSSPVIDSWGTVYFGGGDNRLYAISPDSLIPAKAEIALNGTVFYPGDLLEAWFMLYTDINRPFHVFAAFHTPDGKIYYITSKGQITRSVTPLALNVPGLPAGFRIKFVSMVVPNTASGQYSLVLSFYKPQGPYKPQDAILWISKDFSIGAIATPTPTPTPPTTPTPKPIEVRVSSESVRPGEGFRIELLVNRQISMSVFDAYIVALTPWGVYSVNNKLKWEKGVRPVLSSVEIIEPCRVRLIDVPSMPEWAAGRYTFIAGVVESPKPPKEENAIYMDKKVVQVISGPTARAGNAGDKKLSGL